MHKQLAISVQHLCLESASAKTRYLKLLDMSGPGKSPSVTGEVIASTIIKYLEGEGLDLSKVAGAACDGASVMLGKHQGAMTLFKSHVPQLIVTHCSAHRLSLASCDAAASCSWFVRFEKILSQVYRYFSQSTVRSTKLAEMQKVLSLPQLKLQRPTETRWLSLESAIHALRRSFDAVLEVLKKEGSDGDAMALGLSTHMSSAEFKALLWFLSDVLSILGALSVTFQTKDLNLLSIERIVDSHLSALRTLKGDPFSGGYMIEFKSHHSSVVKELGKECFSLVQAIYCSTY